MVAHFIVPHAIVPHPIVAVGAAGGGLEPLRRITEGLSRRCGATIFVVMHSGAASLLPEILSWHGNLPVAFAVDGERIRQSRIYVAPPDHHMLVDDGRIQLNREPRMHSVRPAIDPTFSSLARAYGKHVMGIILSGGGTDGAAGLLDIEKHGGTVLVQNPEDASLPSMPEAAIVADAPESLTVEEIRLRVTAFCLAKSAA